MRVGIQCYIKARANKLDHAVDEIVIVNPLVLPIFFGGTFLL